MVERQKLKAASLLYRYLFPVYRNLYFRHKRNKNKPELDLIPRFVKPGDIALDIGANIGFFTVYLSDKVGAKGHVYSFEPDETNFRHLEKEIRSRNNVTAIQKAVSSESGTITLYQSGLLNVDHRTYKPEHFTRHYTVEKISIDNFVNGKFKVDFIKMDIQGYEMEALKGMTNTLDANHDLILFTEFWPNGLQQAGSSGTELYDFLEAKKFNLFRVSPGVLSRISRQQVSELKVDYFSDANLIASRNDLMINK